jgi:carboxylesterase
MPFVPSYNVDPARQAYTLEAGPVGVLMMHGFMGAPISSRPLAGYLADRGITVHCPLLPGHGELPNKLYKVPRQSWMQEAEEGYAWISQHCDEIFLMGHSMGTVLNARLASQNEDVRGMILLAPAYDLPDKRLLAMSGLRYVMPWFYPLKMKSLRRLVTERLRDFDPTLDLEDPAIQDRLPELTKVPTSAIDEMSKTLRSGKKLWPTIDLPAIILQGDKDVAVPLENTQKLYEVLPSEEKDFIILPGAGHELMRPFDPAHEKVWPAVYDFIKQRSVTVVGDLALDPL